MKSIFKALAAIFLVGVFAFYIRTNYSVEPEPPATVTPDYSTPLATIGDCAVLDVRAPTLWEGRPVREQMLYDGPGTEFGEHESGGITTGETVFVISECGDWLQARAMNRDLATRALSGDLTGQNPGVDRGNEMLRFWIPADVVGR